MLEHLGSLFAAFFTAVLALCCTAAAAEWRVAKLSGSVYIQSGPMRGLALTRGMVLQPGMVLVADRTGRALLIRVDDQIIVSPNTTIAVPIDRAGGIEEILQGLGESELPVNGQRKPAAEAPYIAAFVKG